MSRHLPRASGLPRLREEEPTNYSSVALKNTIPRVQFPGSLPMEDIVQRPSAMTLETRCQSKQTRGRAGALLLAQDWGHWTEAALHTGNRSHAPLEQAEGAQQQNKHTGLQNAFATVILGGEKEGVNLHLFQSPLWI